MMLWKSIRIPSYRQKHSAASIVIGWQCTDACKISYLSNVDLYHFYLGV